MTDTQILLTALIAIMHVPIWDDGFDGPQVSCSCGWNTRPHAEYVMHFGDDQEDLAMESWLKHQQGSVRLTRAAVDLAIVGQNL